VKLSFHYHVPLYQSSKSTFNTASFHPLNVLGKEISDGPVLSGIMPALSSVMTSTVFDSQYSLESRYKQCNSLDGFLTSSM
jgi:hypothetical protein